MIDIERIVRRGAASLGECLHFYWPSNGSNEIPERNIALHLGAALLQDGFLVYGEAHTKAQVDLRLDLLALHPGSGVQLTAEFKRLYSAEKADQMVADVRRVRDFELCKTYRHGALQVQAGAGLVAAVTWNEAYAKWFTTADEDAEDPTGTGALDRLWKACPKETIYDAAVLSNYHDVDSSKVQTHWLVYALFPTK